MESSSKNDVKSLNSSVIMRFPAGTCLVTENDFSRKMFIIKEGKARVFKSYLGRRITLAILGQGEVFGEMSFFDGEPRSASVEALTDLTAIVVDGENVQKQLPGIPDWIFPIIRMTIRRFRAADQKLAVFQSINEFQKRTSQLNQEAKTIYLEVMRFIKVLSIIHGKLLVPTSNSPQQVRSATLLAEMDDVLGARSIGLKTFWKALKENDLIDHELDEVKGFVAVRENELAKFNLYLSDQVASEKYLLLSHAALSILRHTLGAIGPDGMRAPLASTPVKDLDLEGRALAKEGLDELVQQKLIAIVENEIRFSPILVAETFTYQTILKVFDHTTMNLA